MNRYLKFGLSIAVVVETTLLLLGLGIVNIPTRPAAYFKTIPEVKQMGDQARGKRLRVNGWVKEGSIKREGSNTVFLLVGNPKNGNVGDSPPVVYNGSDPLPRTFEDRAQTLADGKLGGDGVFHAYQIQATCSSFEACSSFAFDIDKPVTLRGKVTQVEWINPHVRLHLDVKGEDGSVVNWMVEGGSTSALHRNSVGRNSLPEGVEIVVDGYQAKEHTGDGTMRANGRNITFADGQKLLLQSASLYAANGVSLRFTP